MAPWPLLLVGSLLAPSAVATEPRGFVTALSCRPEAAPGRVLCELTYQAPSGARLVWVDALVTRAPDFVRPLRSRLGPGRFGAAGSGERRLSLAFVAGQNGVGLVTVRARGVVCRGSGPAESCRPEGHDVQTEIRVGS
ncbi:MAG TPA: hypothetical protein VJN18_08375 [Polyangiaceae bacterium]|nr:hypothetical protein [Polyangiaceae bacterium]